MKEHLSKFGLSIVRKIIIAVIVIFVLLLSLAIYAHIELSETHGISGTFVFQIAVNYTGSWRLVYWDEKYSQGSSIPRNFTIGNLTGSGYYETTATFNYVGYAQKTVCANATKLDYLHNNSTLTLTVLTTSENATAYTPTIEVCASMAV